MKSECDKCGERDSGKGMKSKYKDVRIAFWLVILGFVLVTGYCIKFWLIDSSFNPQALLFIVGIIVILSILLMIVNAVDDLV